MNTASTQTVQLRPLSLVDEGDEVLVGDPEVGTFVAIPAVGGVVISALLRGDTLDEAGAQAEAFAGEPVDLPAFVETLRELGFVDDGAPDEREVARTAPIQNRRWLGGVSQQAIRPFFGGPAWAAYAGLALFCVGVFITTPALLPAPADDAFLLGDIGLGALLLMPFMTLSMATHECGHWLAARAAGLKARFGVDRRMMLLVFETDLTQVWTVPRRSRYSPLLGGIAVDVVMLGLLLGARLLIHHGAWAPPSAIDTALAVGVYLKLAGLLWQCMIFMRTDMYALLVNALGCRNLWRVKSLLVRELFGRLSPDDAAELADASAADRRTGRWFRWVWLGGFAGVLGWFTWFVVPVLVTVLDWAADGVAEGPLDGMFWYALAATAMLLGPYGLASALALKEYIPRRRDVPASS